MSGRSLATLVMAAAAGAGAVVFAWSVGGGSAYLLVPVMVLVVFATRLGGKGGR